MEEARLQVAAALKRLRAARGISLSELSRISGVAKATLSTLEAGDANPTLDTLWALSNALHVSLGELVAPSPAEVSILRAGRGVPLQGDAVRGFLLDQFDVSAAHFEIFSGDIGPSRQVSPGHAAGVVEHMLVTSGRVRVGPIEEPVELETGDYLRMGASQPHLYQGLGGNAHMVLVMQYPR